MRLWIICSGEAAIEKPRRGTLGDYKACCERALDGGAVLAQKRLVRANGREVYCSPRLCARETAEALIPDAEISVEPLLDECALPAKRSERVLPFWLWSFIVWLRRLFGEGKKTARREADELIDLLEKRGGDCILLSHPARITALMDALRARGYCAQRTGFGRVRPGEQMLLSRRDEHCGGCAHNCLLSNPGCNIGRDKAKRQKAGHI